MTKKSRKDKGKDKKGQTRFRKHKSSHKRIRETYGRLNRRPSEVSVKFAYTIRRLAR